MTTEEQAQAKQDKQDELHPLVKKVLTDVRLLLATMGTLIVTIFLGGWSAYAQVQTATRDAGQEFVQPIQLELKTVQATQDKHNREASDIHRAQQAQLDQQREQLKNVERVTFETSLNVRLLLQAQGIKPIIVIQPEDGGHQ